MLKKVAASTVAYRRLATIFNAGRASTKFVIEDLASVAQADVCGTDVPMLIELRRLYKERSVSHDFLEHLQYLELKASAPGECSLAAPGPPLRTVMDPGPRASLVLDAKLQALGTLPRLPVSLW